jgi:cytochrome c peroxidase
MAHRRRGLSPVAALGERLFRDESLSVSARLALPDLSPPEFAHAAPPGDPVSKGGPGMVPGIRNSPSIRYASFTPPFGYDKEGAAFGGLFRDGRADAWLVEQAKLPFLDAREMANATPADVIARLRRSPNAAQFRQVFGADARRRGRGLLETRCCNCTGSKSRIRIFTGSDSRYDAYLAGKAGLTPQEEREPFAFRGTPRRAIARPATRASAATTRTAALPISLDNVGTPRSARIPANADPAFFDLGLCGPERKYLAARLDLCGAFKVPTLRNIARTAPYFHNCSFDNLRDVVDFYARRDTEPALWYPKSATGARKFDDLPGQDRSAVNVSEVPYDRKPGERACLTPRRSTMSSHS